MEDRSFNMYKGLQKPLVFKGFSGRYIYWGVGTILTALITGILCFIIFNKAVGFLVIAIILGSGLYYTSSKQKKGLYSKKADNNIIFIIPNRINIHRIKK